MNVKTRLASLEKAFMPDFDSMSYEEFYTWLDSNFGTEEALRLRTEVEEEFYRNQQERTNL